MEKKCVFCQIAKGKIPAQVIYENKQLLAFLDNQPEASGHILIIPKEHFATLLDVPADILTNLVRVLQKIAQNIANQLHPDGFNVYQNSGSFAGQTINHLHFHLIPRYRQDPSIDKKNFPLIVKTLRKEIISYD